MNYSSYPCDDQSKVSKMDLLYNQKKNNRLKPPFTKPKTKKKVNFKDQQESVEHFSNPPKKEYKVDSKTLKNNENKSSYNNLISYQRENNDFGIFLPLDFNWEKYIELNPDLNSLNKKTAEKHYVTFGFHEKRLYNDTGVKESTREILVPPGFQWREYVRLNKDLSDLNQNEAEKHYYNHGFKEGRIFLEGQKMIETKKRVGIPQDFDWVAYKQINYLPHSLNIKAVEQHYLQFGKKQHKKYKYEGKTYSIGGRKFQSPENTPVSKTYLSSSIINSNYGKTTICFISQGDSKYEMMSKILALSTRCFNPLIDIIIGLPTPFNIYPKVAQETLTLFDNLNIKYIEITNQISHNYKIGNKYALLEKVSEISNNSYILFLDTDIICTNPFVPTKEMLEADLSGITTDYSDWVNKINKLNFNKSFWYKIHKVCDSVYEPEKYNPPHLSCVTNRPIYADYFNGGYIFIKNNPLIPKTLNSMTEKIYNYLFNKPNTASFTSDQIALAVTSSSLNLKTHVIDMEHIYSCIPKHYPSKIVTNQQFYHYHNPKCLRSIFINFDHRQYNLGYKGIYREGDNLLFNNLFYFKIVNALIKDWKYLFRPNEVTEGFVDNDFRCFKNFLKEFIIKK